MKSYKTHYLKDNLMRAYTDGQVNAEATARLAADTNLQSLISTETTNRQNADTTLQSGIDSKIASSLIGVPNGLATLDALGHLVLSQAPAIAASGNVFILRPGEPTPTGNIYATFSALMTATLNVKGLKYIQFDSTLQAISIPADNLDLSEFILMPRYPRQIPLAITFLSGFLVSGWPVEIRGLSITFESHFYDHAGTKLLALTDSELLYSGTSNNGVDFSSGTLNVVLKNSRIAASVATAVVFGVAGRTLKIFTVAGNSSVETDVISGTAGGTLQIFNYGATVSRDNGQVVDTQPRFLGARTDVDYLYALQKTLTSKGQLVTRNGGGAFVATPVGADNELLAFDSTTTSGLKSVAAPPAFNTPGMKTITDFARQSSPTTALLSAGSRTLDCATANLFRITGGTATFTLSNLTENQVVNIVLESTGAAYTLTWAGGTFLWSGATVPTPTSTASRKDIYTFIKINGQIFGSAVLNMG